MELSVGGGFGIKYIPTDDPAPLGQMCADLVKWAEDEASKRGVNIKKLIAEPGRLWRRSGQRDIYRRRYEEKRR